MASTYPVFVFNRSAPEHEDTVPFKEVCLSCAIRLTIAHPESKLALRTTSNDMKLCDECGWFISGRIQI